MRHALLLVAALSACTPLPLPTSAPGGSGVTPDASGLQPGGTDLRIDFGRAEAGVIETVSRLVGSQPADVTLIEECGAGPVTAAYWRNGLTTNFLDGDFVGWTVTEPGLPVAGGLSVGMSPPPVQMTETTLGQEFESNGIWALIGEDSTDITVLWSGISCFFR
ncbi:hypothetical protein [Nioella aestuarii]|uniref:hypothetical protein n=1 Tax=Nioella aestuarii TaxID=1662864 RepID=UPI003D7FC390